MGSGHIIQKEQRPKWIKLLSNYMINLVGTRNQTKIINFRVHELYRPNIGTARRIHTVKRVKKMIYTQQIERKTTQVSMLT